MILGLNTDVRYKGKTFHIQTEDSGLQNPVLITHVFIGGTIIETRRTEYRDALEREGLEDHVRSLMRGQHRSTYKALLNGDFDEAAKRTAKKKVTSIPLAKKKGVGIFSPKKSTGTHSVAAPAASAPPGVAPAPSGVAPAPSGIAPAPSGVAPAPSGVAPAPPRKVPGPGSMPALPKVNSMASAPIEELDEDDLELLDPDDLEPIGDLDDEPEAPHFPGRVEAIAPDAFGEPESVEFPTELVCGRPLDPVLLGYLLEDVD